MTFERIEELLRAVFEGVVGEHNLAAARGAGACRGPVGERRVHE